MKNLTVADAEVTVPQSELAGILCGMMANDATASGVSVSGSVAGKAGVGGIAGGIYGAGQQHGIPRVQRGKLLPCKRRC